MPPKTSTIISILTFFIAGAGGIALFQQPDEFTTKEKRRLISFARKFIINREDSYLKSTAIEKSKVPSWKACCTKERQ